MAENTFVNTYIRTISSQPVTYPDNYAQPPSNSLKRIPVLPIDVPPVPERADKPGESSSDIELTLKSLKPAKSIVVTVKGTDTIADLKSKWDTGGGEVRLLLKGKALQDAKLVREYGFNGGDVVNVIVKAAPAPPAEPLPSKPSTPSLAIDTAPHIKKHGRIPSVVLSPSPSITGGPGSDDGRRTPDILLNLDGEGELSKDVTAYHATLANPEMWEASACSEFHTNSEAQMAFEDFLRAAKGVLTASEVAKIRDQVGVIGMAGT
ncbi:hypothetical protein BDZ89DRAFT_1086129 [Hymenopellis radicata]|nr:hypothetical protein BDZ89DRAFT_1086129 [Hymenopellis radicata]